MDFKDALMKGEENVLISLPIHQLIRQMQHTNGIKHHDHMRYCRFLTRKLARIRKSLGLVLNFDSPGSGKGGRGSSKTRPENRETLFSADIVTSTSHLIVPLLYAERAWSTAAAKKDALINTSKQKLRHTGLSRHGKAVKWARALEALCKAVPNCDPVTALEASAYASCLEGQLLLEKEQWHAAVAEFSKARGIYEELSKVGDLEQRDIFSERIMSSVAPSLRFCKYNLSSDYQEQDEDYDVDFILENDQDLFTKLQHLRSKRRADSEIGVQSAEDDQKSASGPFGGLARGNLNWCGRRIILPSDDLKPCLLEVEIAFEAFYSKNAVAGSSGLENCISTLDDALRRTHEVQATVLKGSNVSTAVSSTDALTSLQHLQYFLQYRKLACYSLRNLELITSISGVVEMDKWTHAQELAHLYKQLGQNVNEMMTLVEGACASLRSQNDGVDSNDDGDGEEDDVIVLRLRSEQTLYRAYRLVALADCYALAPVGTGEGNKKDMLIKASTLVDLADELMSSTVYNNVENFAQSVESMGRDDNKDFAMDLEEVRRQQSNVSTLEKMITGAKLRYSASLFLNEAQSDLLTGICDDFICPIMQNKNVWITSPLDTVKTNVSTNSNVAKSNASSKASFDSILLNSAINVCNIPPSFAPIPCKPVFYDVALNHLDMTGDGLGHGSQSQVSKDIDRRSGVSKESSTSSGTDEPSTGLVGAAAKSFYGWWSGDGK